MNPGKMCGTLAAHLISEPATQMTFHYAGISSRNVMLGVLHLKETISVPTNIKMSSLSVYLARPNSQSNTLAKNVEQELACTRHSKPSLLW